jgi:release factor glutamine methyltransferase
MTSYAASVRFGSISKCFRMFMTPTPVATSLRDLLAGATDMLAAAGIDTPAFDARVIAAHVLDTSLAAMPTMLERPLSAVDVRMIDHLLALRGCRMPLNYVLGDAEFMGLRFRSDSRALSPRQETELLAETCIARIGAAPPAAGLLIDVGCGSGVLGLSVAHSFDDITLIGSDISLPALELFNENVHILGLANRAHSVAGAFLDWLSPQHARSVRYVVSNPPYVRPDIYSTLQPEIVDYEPRCALISPTADGIGAYRRIADALHHMMDLRFAGFEIGYDEVHVIDIMNRARPDMTWELHNDYGRHPRIVLGETNG